MQPRYPHPPTVLPVQVTGSVGADSITITLEAVDGIVIFDDRCPTGVWPQALIKEEVT